jgi:hypothetical protein
MPGQGRVVDYAGTPHAPASVHGPLSGKMKPATHGDTKEAARIMLPTLLVVLVTVYRR